MQNAVQRLGADASSSARQRATSLGLDTDELAEAQSVLAIVATHDGTSSRWGRHNDRSEWLRLESVSARMVEWRRLA